MEYVLLYMGYYVFVWVIFGSYTTDPIRGIRARADLRLALQGTKHGRKGWNLRGFRQMKHLVKRAFDGET